MLLLAWEGHCILFLIAVLCCWRQWCQSTNENQEINHRRTKISWKILECYSVKAPAKWIDSYWNQLCTFVFAHRAYRHGFPSHTFLHSGSIWLLYICAVVWLPVHQKFLWQQKFQPGISKHVGFPATLTQYWLVPSVKINGSLPYFQRASNFKCTLSVLFNGQTIRVVLFPSKFRPFYLPSFCYNAVGMESNIVHPKKCSPHT